MGTRSRASGGEAALAFRAHPGAAPVTVAGWAAEPTAVRPRPPARMRRCLLERGKALGRPWTQDERRAALVAWLALSEAPARSA